MKISNGLKYHQGQTPQLVYRKILDKSKLKVICVQIGYLEGFEWSQFKFKHEEFIDTCVSNIIEVLIQKSKLSKWLVDKL